VEHTKPWPPRNKVVNGLQPQNRLEFRGNRQRKICRRKIQTNTRVWSLAHKTRQSLQRNELNYSAESPILNSQLTKISKYITMDIKKIDK